MVALLGVSLGICMVPVIDSHQALVNSDWPAFATGGQLAVSDPAHLYDLTAQARVQRTITGGAVLQASDEVGLLPFNMPPWVAILNAPFAALGTDVGARLWIALELLALAIGFILLAPPARRAAALPAFAAVPTALAALNAQTDGLVILGIGAAWALRRHDRHFLAGLALGSCLVKPQLVLPIGAAVLLTRSWRTLAGWAAAAAALVLVCMALRPAWVPDWLHFLSATAGRIGTEIGPAQFVWASGLPRSAQVAGAAVVTIVATAVVLWLARRHREGIAAGLLITGGLLAAPHALGSDLVLPAAGLVVSERARWWLWLALSVLALTAAVLKGTIGAPLAGVSLAALCLGRLAQGRDPATANL
jgi:hypothetical protein